MSVSVEVKEGIVNAIRKGCRVEYEPGLFLGKSWFELKGEGVDVVRELVKIDPDQGARLLSLVYSPVFRNQLERDGEEAEMFYKGFLNWSQNEPADYAKEMHDNPLSPSIVGEYNDICNRCKSLMRSLDRGAIVNIVVPLGRPNEFAEAGYDGRLYNGRFAPDGVRVDLRLPQPQETAV